MATPRLYERLGGVYSIATVVDDFIDRIMIDPRLNANPRIDEAHHRVPPAGFKYLVTEMVCWAAGGPQKYTGRSMKLLPIHQSRRCGAKTRKGTPCQSPAMPNGRCRMHGGKSPGAPKGNRNAWKHGHYSAEANALRQLVRQLLSATKDTLTE